MDEARAPLDEAAELERRALELQVEIASRRARIRRLQGLPPREDAEPSPLRRALRVEVEVELPPLDPARAHGALLDAIHRETGLVGAVRTREGELEWKTFEPSSARRALEVHLEGSRLRLRDRAGSAADPSGWASFGAGIFLAAVTLLLAPPAGGLGAPRLAMGLILLALPASRILTRRRGRRALERLAASIASALPLRRTEARVEEEEALEEALEARPPSSKEASRGLP